MELDLRFSSKVAEKFFFCDRRNIAWVSGFGAGKTWAAIQKALVLMHTFPGYRVLIARKSATELKRTTKQTFYKVCPPEWISHDPEGNVPETTLYNGSKIYWMHVDQFSVSALLSLEINMAIYDQAEDLIESVFLAMDSRIGRWDRVEIPSELKDKLPKNKFTGKPSPPSYHILLFNPPDEGEFSWLYQSCEPKSDLRVDFKHADKNSWFIHKESLTHAFFESSSTLNEALNEENLQANLTRDPEWIERFVHGKRSQGSGAIHKISPDSILDVDLNWFKEKIFPKAALCRVLDHGATSPTCCTWWATLGSKHFCYREYYSPDKVISYHRREISLLSEGEFYVGNYADPSIFKRDPQLSGGRRSVSDEYSDLDIFHEMPGDAPPIYFSPADNNEFATRNSINELLLSSPIHTHPVTEEKGAPSIYFLRESPKYPNGCNQVIRETMAQKKVLLDTINGKPIYSDERDPDVVDHAYDTLRYFVSIHQKGKRTPSPRPSYGSFRETMKRIKARKIYNEMREMVQ